MGGRSGIRLAIFLVTVLLCLLFTGWMGTVAGSQPAAVQPPSEAGVGDIETEAFEADRTVFIIEVRENGSAEWRFRYEQRLETDADIADFEAYADRFNTEETDSFRNFRERAIALADSGSNATGREMAAGQFRRDARIEERPPAGDEFGVIEMSFVWNGFAVTEGEEVVVGDVFIGGLYVGPDQQLRFERGPNLQFESAAPKPDTTAAETVSESETITWLGEESFADRQPRVVFVERRSDTSPTGPGSEPAGDPDATDDTDGSVVPLVAVTIVILLGGSAAFVYRAGLFATGAVDAGESPSREPSVDPHAETVPATQGDLGSVEPDTDEPDPSNAEGPQKISDEELLSDEKRVIELLKTQGGRMKQVEIVNRTDWSKSKVSMLLSDMESEGTISKLRVGRENIISLAGHEPDAAGSPFDDE